MSRRLLSGQRSRPCGTGEVESVYAEWMRRFETHSMADDVDGLERHVEGCGDQWPRLTILVGVINDVVLVIDDGLG